MSKHRLILLLSCYVMTLVVVQYGVAKTPDSILSGDYILTQYSGSGEESGAYYISINFAGDGTGSYEIIYSSSGYIKSGPFTYSVYDDGTFSLTDPDMKDNPLQGIVSTDGESFTMWTEPGILVGIKKSSGMSNASLGGEYIITGYYTADMEESVAYYISMILDGEGTGTFEIILSSSGDKFSLPLTYSVNDDGTFLITLIDNGDEDIFQGIVSSDGESLTMVLTYNDEFGIFAGIKKSSGMSNVSLSDEYIMIQFITAEETSAEYFSVNFAGDGTGTSEIIYSSIGDYGSGSFTYSVNDDGTFLITIPEEGDTFQGIVSSDGESFTMVLTESSEFGIYTGIAKSDFKVGIHENHSELPDYYTLKQNYPNPFNPSTTIQYDVPKNTQVVLKIYNLAGQEVRTLVDENQSAGYRSVIWDGKNNRGYSVSSGIYIYRLKTPEFLKTKKLLLIR
ncbi:FlgD immunoglobulin-like domain containing protein [Candidatus Latescibacterota bacterium]